MSVLFSYPGQGAQRAGMLHDLPDQAVVQYTLDEASATLGRDVRRLDGDAALASTVAVQLCLLVAGVAMSRCLEQLAGLPDAVAGLSIGAYPAAVTAGVLGFADAVRLVERRATLMAQACPSGFGMTAILGLERPALEALIARVHAPQSPVYLANLNAPAQLVISGALPALERVAALALDAGAHAARPIAIGVPSHCALLEAPAAQLASAFDKVRLGVPRLRYYSASAARELRDPRRIADDLVHNMARPVRWHETALLARERGARLAIEMPPGNVLTKLAGAAMPQVLAVAAGETRVDTLAALMDRERQRGE